MDAPAYHRGGRHLTVLGGRVSVCRLAADAAVPAWVPTSGAFTALVRTSEELSITCDETVVPPGVRAERGFRAIAIRGPLPFEAVGVMASLTGPLARAGISVLAISTFDTDYVLVREAALGTAIEALRAAGHHVA